MDRCPIIQINIVRDDVPISNATILPMVETLLIVSSVRRTTSTFARTKRNVVTIC